MPGNTDYSGVSKYNNPENGLELSIKDYNTDRTIDPSKIKNFKTESSKEYILKIPYSNKKAVTFATHIDNLQYSVMWVTGEKLDQMVYRFVDMYLSLREAYAKQSRNFDDEVRFAFDNDEARLGYFSSENDDDENRSGIFDSGLFGYEDENETVNKNILNLYKKKDIDEMLANRNKRNISFDNEFFNVYIKKVKLENGVKGTKIVFDSDYNFSGHLPGIINSTRADKNRDFNKVKTENMQIENMIKDFLRYYVQIGKIGMKSDENVSNTPENMYGFSMN